MQKVSVTFVEQPKVVELRTSDMEIPEGWIAGHTQYSLISAGTEINASYLNVFNWPRPSGSGYAAVFRVEVEAGEFHKGDLAFVCGNHASMQCCRPEDAVKLPDGLDPCHALFARMAGVSMASLGRVSASKGETVLVTGLGAVGLMAAQSWRCEGYTVICIEIDPKRRALAEKLGFETYENTEAAQEYKGKIGLVLECTGVQKITAEAADMLREHGEMSLVGVPWKKTDDEDAFRLLNRIFYSYLKVYSGWEMDLTPLQRNQDYARTMQRMHAGEIRAEGLFEVRSWKDAQAVYDGIYDKSIKSMSVMFDWRDCL